MSASCRNRNRSYVSLWHITSALMTVYVNATEHLRDSVIIIENPNARGIEQNSLPSRSFEPSAVKWKRIAGANHFNSYSPDHGGSRSSYIIDGTKAVQGANDTGSVKNLGIHDHMLQNDKQQHSKDEAKRGIPASTIPRRYNWEIRSNASISHDREEQLQKSFLAEKNEYIGHKGVGGLPLKKVSLLSSKKHQETDKVGSAGTPDRVTATKGCQNGCKCPPLTMGSSFIWLVCIFKWIELISILSKPYSKRILSYSYFVEGGGYCLLAPLIGALGGWVISYPMTHCPPTSFLFSSTMILMPFCLVTHREQGAICGSIALGSLGVALGYHFRIIANNAPVTMLALGLLGVLLGTVLGYIPLMGLKVCLRAQDYQEKMMQKDIQEVSEQSSEYSDITEENKIQDY